MSELAIIVPVLGRPRRALPLAESVSRATEGFDLLFVCSPGDEEQIAACQATGALTVVADWEPGPGDYARKVQLGFRQCAAPFVFQGADDLSFEPGWAEAALAELERAGAGICGTNDLGNPLVMQGRHSTHTLVRRAYIEECGGTFDERPGQLLCEAYDHQFVDTELCWLARERGCWSFAAEARVAHLHPLWHPSVPRDATYEKALARGREDARLFMQRKQAWLRRQRRAVA